MPGTGETQTAEVRIRVVVRDVVAGLAPEELVLLDGLNSLDDATISRRFERKLRGDALGFGWTEAVPLMSPLVWVALNQAIGRFRESAADSTIKAAKSLLRRATRRSAAATVIPPLSQEQLGEVRQLILETAARQGLSDARAQAVADGVTLRLTMRPADSLGHAEPGPEPLSAG